MRENKEEIEDGKSLGYRQHKALCKYITGLGFKSSKSASLLVFTTHRYCLHVLIWVRLEDLIYNLFGLTTYKNKNILA